MSDYGSLVERIREAEAAASRLESALRQEPNDRALRLDFLSARHLAEKLKEELLEIAPQEWMDVCSYRIVPETSNDYSIAGVTGSLRGFQDMFTLVFAAISGGPKRTAHVSAEITRQTTLSIAYTFAGSFGVVLTASDAKTLFGDTFDSAVNALSQIVEIKRQDDVRSIAERYGKAVVTKAFEWSRNNYERSYAVDLKWRNVEGIERGKFITKTDFVRVLDVIGLTSDAVKHIISVSGIFVGGDIITRRFHFVDEHDQDYRGDLSRGFEAEALELGKRYTARILVETTTRYATGEEDRRYTLMALEAERSP